MHEGRPGCGLGHTAAVRSRPDGLSPYGAYDLSGNVWEWVSDWYGPDYTKTSTDTNPPGPSGPAAGSHRVIRGGSWGGGGGDLRASNRYGGVPGVRFVNLAVLGFRCARGLEP